MNTANSGHVYYRCFRRMRYRDCNNHYVRASNTVSEKGLDAVVWELVCQWVRNPQILYTEYMRHLQENENERLRRQLIEDLSAKRRILCGLLQQKDELLDLRLEGLLTPEELKKRMVALERKKRQLEDQMKDLESRVSRLRADAVLDTSFEDYCALIAQNLDKLSDEEKKKVLNWIGLKVLVHPDHVVISLPVPMCCEGTKFEGLVSVTQHL